jgi:hypothetical protein
MRSTLAVVALPLGFCRHRCHVAIDGVLPAASICRLCRSVDFHFVAIAPAAFAPAVDSNQLLPCSQSRAAAIAIGSRDTSCSLFSGRDDAMYWTLSVLSPPWLVLTAFVVGLIHSGSVGSIDA